MVNNNCWSNETGGGARWSTTMAGTTILEVELDGQELELVKEFVYLGTTKAETATPERVAIIQTARATTALSRLQLI